MFEWEPIVFLMLICGDL